jgi:hypothetical protein
LPPLTPTHYERAPTEIPSEREKKRDRDKPLARLVVFNLNLCTIIKSNSNKLYIFTF